MRNICNKVLCDITTGIIKKMHANRFERECDWVGYKELNTYVSIAMPGYTIFVFDYSDVEDIAEILVRWGDVTDLHDTPAQVDDFEMSFMVIAIKP